jgi:Phage major capsid protein E
MDIFRDYFTRENLARALEKAPYTPGQLGASGMFETVGLTSTTFAVEEQTTDAGRLLTAISRGSPRTQTSLEKRKVHTFTTASYGDQGTVYADEVLNARGAGTAGMAEVVTDRRDRIVRKLRLNMDLTMEGLRMACLLAPGTTEFGTAGTEQTIAVQTDATKTRQEIFTKIIKPVESALGGIPFRGIHVWCSDGYWQDLLENKQIRETYLNWTDAAALRGDPRQAFTFGGVMWERYRGVTGCEITADKAVVAPVGVPEMFWQAFAPNDTMESVGTGALGQPYYMGSKPITDSQGTKGMEASVQTHPKVVCGRPGAVFLIKKA